MKRQFHRLNQEGPFYLGICAVWFDKDKKKNFLKRKKENSDIYMLTTDRIEDGLKIINK